jgi:hypothetical protein
VARMREATSGSLLLILAYRKARHRVRVRGTRWPCGLLGLEATADMSADLPGGYLVICLSSPILKNISFCA